MDINDLRRARKAAADKMQSSADAISALEAVAGGPDADDLAAAEAAFAEAQQEFAAADAKVKRAETVEAAQAASAVSETDTPPVQPQAQAMPARAKEPGQEGVELGFMVHALANAKGDRDRAVARLEADGHSAISASLSGASEAARGVTVPRALASGIIDLLKPRVLVRASGARVHDMPAGELRNARVASGPTASYAAENAAMEDSEPTFDKVDEKFKKLTCLVPVGNSLLRHSSIGVAQVVRDLMLDAMALKEDIAFLRYDGSANDPKGLLHWCLAANWQDAVGNSAAVVEAALRKVVSDVEDANVGMISPGWGMRASTKNFLASLRDPTGAYMFPSILQSGTLLGYPVRTTSQIPNNLGAGSDETEVYFADFAEIMIGESQQIVVGSSTEAAFVNQAGDTVSAYQSDLTLMRAIAEHDLAPAHDEAIAGLNGIGWSL
ncbi:phage major capsid protein [Pontibaca salina]|uniref:Phage major capsid protein n=1 Tax=Pontibaca salina TaxID=2795731 RepID=A0A934LX90_9RHOB|nr:phage major capsid protein [Pontibaca salina]MBI6628332.1 phage major capsid protein [Pontibaca salina]